jgi:uncharacterized phiE125 gp8 family phage protein
MYIFSKSYTWTDPQIITLTQAKANLRVTHDLDDAEIQQMIYAAYQSIESILNRLLIDQSITYQIETTSDSFDFEISEPQTYKEFGTLTAIDTSGNISTPESYTLKLDGNVVEISNITFASPTDVNAYRFVITYEPNLLNYSINAAVFLMLTHYYENRNAVVIGTTSKELPLGVDRILSAFRYIPM